ncbi:threonine/serine exporter family protein [Heyndrickxia coagulans]|uniref:Threonine/serine exporter family protein n=1 Tax=Heyndrickxia coagulans TaxID=1398 RepID=A0AAW7CFZ7_HEYCO|nr:threonine/serine exporter family protein [Heyndrickxia coagulans]MDL5041628.1 threonine/serine exporter family protein [Heyndrickxia coagulans]
MFQQLLTSFFSSAGFGILFNAPRKLLIQCGITGMIGWGIYFLFYLYEQNVVYGTFIAAFFVGIISQVFARFYKTPILIFTVGGIIPLVPGGLAYEAMRHFVQNDYNGAVSLAAKVLLLSVAIAIGLVASEVANQLIKKLPDKRPRMSK